MPASADGTVPVACRRQSEAWPDQAKIKACRKTCSQWGAHMSAIPAIPHLRPETRPREGKRACHCSLHCRSPILPWSWPPYPWKHCKTVEIKSVSPLAGVHSDLSSCHFLPSTCCRSSSRAVTPHCNHCRRPVSPNLDHAQNVVSIVPRTNFVPISKFFLPPTGSFCTWCGTPSRNLALLPSQPPCRPIQDPGEQGNR